MKHARHKNEIERQIIVALVEDALAAGYALGVNDGEETTLKRCTDEAAIFAALSTTDEDYLLYWRQAEPPADGVCPDDGNGLADDGVCGFCGNRPAERMDDHYGWVRLIYGNDCDVISDYALWLGEETEVLNRAERLAGRFRGDADPAEAVA